MFSSSAFHHPCPLLQWSDQRCCQATHTEEILNITLGSHNIYLHIIPDPFSVECSFYNSHLRSQKQAQCHKLHRFQHSNPCGWLLRRQNSHHTTSALGTSASDWLRFNLLPERQVLSRRTCTVARWFSLFDMTPHVEEDIQGHKEFVGYVEYPCMMSSNWLAKGPAIGSKPTFRILV